MQDAQKQIQDTAGVYSSFLGQQDGGATSGVAINSLVEQGATTLSEINDNYRYAKRLVGELITANIVHDLSKERDVKVLVGVNEHQKTKRIMLNTEQEDEFGYTRITNDVMRTKSHVVLADISSTPGYRAQVTDRLMQLVQGLPPEMQAAVIDIVIESTDLPKKKEILDRIRKATGQGMDPEDMSEEDKQAYQLQMEKKQQQEQLLMQQQQLAIEEMTTKIEKLRNESAQLAAKTRQLEALTEHEDAKERQTEAKTQQIMVEMQNLTQEMQQLREGFVHNLDQQIDALAHTGP
jgi:DNA repair exonuclease SbcCD ATPase subunit